MKKKILSATLVVAMAAIAGYNMYQSQMKCSLSELALANVEALANNEAPGGNTQDCPGGSCSFSDSTGRSCTACCPKEKSPECSVFSCTCL